MNVKQIFVVTSIALTLTILVLGLINAYFLILFLFVGPIIGIGIVDMVQKKQTIRRNFPIIGNFRYMLEKVRPEIMQYFVETDTEGRPINRLYRSVIYQRAKKEVSTSPFGTQWDVYHPGYEWIDHSVYAVNPHDLEQEQRVLVGQINARVHRPSDPSDVRTLAARAPTRIDFGGGWTDVPPFSGRE